MPRPKSAKSVIHWTDGIVLGAVAILAAASLVSYFGFDERVLSWLMESSIHWNANFWVHAFTLLGKSWLQVWLLLVWLLTKRRRTDAVAGLVALVLVASGVGVTKWAVARPRPYELVNLQTANHRAHNVSFPSGDTATAVAVAVAILPGVTGPVRYVLPLACVGIGWLRIAGLAHYPSDVLAGAAMGLLGGWLARRLVAKQRRPERDLPLESWLVPGGIVGIPAGIALLNGFPEEMLFLYAYGTPILGFWIARRVGAAVRAAPERALSFLARWQFPALVATFTVVIAGDILMGDKPRELLPLGGQSVSPIAVLGLLLVAAGVSIRLSAHALNDPAGLAPAEPAVNTLHGMAFGMFLVVCGLLCQLQDWTTWFVALPVFALFYGMPMLGEDLTLSHLRDAQWWSDFSRPFFVRLFTSHPSLSHRPQPRYWRPCVRTRELCAALALLLLPFAIEVLIEDLVFENWLHL